MQQPSPPENPNRSLANYALGLIALLVAARVDARRSVNCPADCKLTIHKFFLNRNKRRASPPPDTAATL